MNRSTIKLASVFTLTLSVSMAGTAGAATYAGQFCVGRTGELTYSVSGASVGARNNNDGEIYISCPITRNKDHYYSTISGIVYFENDAKEKWCSLDSYNLDNGLLWVWSVAAGDEQVRFSELEDSQPWAPLALNCALPASSRILGYQFIE